MGKKVKFIGALSVTAALVLAPAFAAHASTVTVSSNFNSGDQVAESYTLYTADGTIEQVAGDGISGSGSLYADPSETDGFLITKQAFDVSGVGQSVTLSAFVHNTDDDGYFTMGVTSYADASSHTTNDSAVRPSDAVGYGSHGGGFVSFAEDEEVDGLWHQDNAANFDPIHIAPVFGMIGAASDDQWYKVVVTVTRVSDTAFKQNVAVWPANADGTFVDGATEPMAEFERTPNAPTLASASQVYGFIGFAWNRFDHADNVAISGDPATASGSADALADTGQNTMLPGVLAITSLLAGAVVLVAVRRRQSS